jgi:hypothetical protein
MPMVAQYPQQETSTFLRYMSVCAATSEGDFKFDESKAMIKTSHLWIAEAKSEEELNHRYSSATFFIMAVLSPLIERDKGSNKDLVELFTEIEQQFATCDIVTVRSDQEGLNTSREMRIQCFTTHKDPRDQKTGIKEVPNSELICNVEDYAIALEAQRENGYRRINCTAKSLYYKAMKLAYLSGYIKPEESLNLRSTTARADESRKEENSMRGRA